MRNPFIAVWDYMRNSWEGDDGKFSFKRASAFVFIWLMVFMILRNRVSSQYGFYSFLVLAVLFALIVAIITVAQLIILAGVLDKRAALGTFTNDNTTTDEQDIKLPSTADSIAE